MRYRIVLGVVALAACLPALAAGQDVPASDATPVVLPQRERTWEISGSIATMYLDRLVAGVVQRTDASTGRTAIGGVVRVGYIFSKHWSVSVGAGAGQTTPALVLQPFAALSWTPNVNAHFSPFVTLGGGVTSVRWSNGGSWSFTSKYGANLGLGFRQSLLGERTVVRIEVREQIEHDSFPPQPVFNAIGSVGLSFFLGGGMAVASITVDPPVVTLESLDATQQLSAIPMDSRGRPRVGRAITWTSSDDAVATVSATGLVRAVGDGSATITAASKGVTGTMSVTVAQATASLAIAPDSAALTAIGQTQPFTVTALDAGNYTVGNPAVTWSSSDSTVASVDAAGLVTAARTGTARITASTDNGRTAAATVNVAQAVASVAVTPLTATIDTPGGTAQFTAQAMDANGHAIAGAEFSWTSDAPGVATVSPTGLATAVGNGTARLSAAVEGQTGLAALTVEVPVGRAVPRVHVDTTAGAPPVLAVNATLVLRNVIFRPNSAVLPPEARADLDAVAVAMRAIPDARWEISGHTSGMGDAAKNLRLSQRRAAAVKAYFVRQGVPASALTAVGYGSAHPVATNATVAGRRANMRVELKRLQ